MEFLVWYSPKIYITFNGGFYSFSRVANFYFNEKLFSIWSFKPSCCLPSIFPWFQKSKRLCVVLRVAARDYTFFLLNSACSHGYNPNIKSKNQSFFHISFICKMSTKIIWHSFEFLLSSLYCIVQTAHKKLHSFLHM